MFESNKMKILQLETQLFPDSDTVKESIKLLEEENTVIRIDLGKKTLSESDWDSVVKAILAAELTITV